MLRDVVTSDNTASDIRADTAYRSQANEKWLKAQGRGSRIHRRKPKGKPMPDQIRRGNATKSQLRTRVEHVFAQQKAQMGLFIRAIGINRAEAKITLAILAYNMNRLIFRERRVAVE
jgi:IS5 family transposase